MKMKYTLAALAVTTMAANAALSSFRDYSADFDTTGENADGAYIWGMEIDPINNVANVDVDGNAVFDFHSSGTTAVNVADGKAGHADGTLFRWDYTGAPTRGTSGYENGTGKDYTFEIGLDILGTGTEGTRGVFGIALEMGSSYTSGDVQLEIGEDSLTFQGGAFINTTIAPSFLAGDNTGYHTWRIAHDNTANTLYIWKDAVLIDVGANGFDLTDVGTHNGAPGNTFIGDYSGGLAGDWQLDYIALDTTGAFDAVPEPSSTALLGLGGLALILRRRK
ncbi:MAG: PEP-CTERM sorting domain-containing protein [Akkermansiaceae bacterium]